MTAPSFSDVTLYDMDKITCAKPQQNINQVFDVLYIISIIQTVCCVWLWFGIGLFHPLPSGLPHI